MRWNGCLPSWTSGIHWASAITPWWRSSIQPESAALNSTTQCCTTRTPDARRGLPARARELRTGYRSVTAPPKGSTSSSARPGVVPWWNRTMDPSSLQCRRTVQPRPPGRLGARCTVDAAKIGRRGPCYLFHHTLPTPMLEGGPEDPLHPADLKTTPIYTQVSIR